MRFHPTMVLAQRDHESESPARNRFPSHYGSRSTRSWTDGIFSRLELFPSHYGSRSTSYRKNQLLLVLTSFHPTMVLAQQNGVFTVSLINSVSIPLWFSLNEVNRVIDEEKLVSIPLWFSLNGMRAAGTALVTSFHPTMVLAQPRYDGGTYYVICEFPSHYGSRSTSSTPRWHCTSPCFHPTMVLAQRKFITGISDDELFPSHYGSRSTRHHRRQAPCNHTFPSHYGSRSTQRSA